MRKLVLALTAVTMVAPVVPMSAASAQNGYYQGRTWHDAQGRTRCKKKNGTTGLLVGAAGGALVGRSIDTHGSRATGTIVGAAAGALLGRHVDRNSGKNRYRCR